VAEVEFDLVAIVFAHARAQTLDEALEQILVELPKHGLRTAAVIHTDRCTPPVRTVVQKWLDTGFVLGTIDSKVPVRSPEHGETFNLARSSGLWFLDYLGVKAQWASFWDDDWLLADPARAVRALLLHMDVPYWKAAILFAWTPDGQINIRQHHCSPLFFRYQPYMHMHPKWHTHVPEELRMQEGEILGSYLLDRGAATVEERLALYKECARAGKCDAYTQRLVQPPQLKTMAEVLKIWPSPEEFVAWQTTQRM